MRQVSSMAELFIVLFLVFGAVAFILWLVDIFDG
jgi:hypothetical protein